MASTSQKIQTHNTNDKLRIELTGALNEASNAKGETQRLMDEVQKAIDALKKNDTIEARKILMDLVGTQ